MKTKVCILSIVALLTFGQQAMCQRSNNTKSSTSVRGGNTKSSSTSRNSNTKATPSTQNNNTKAASGTRNNNSRTSSNTKNSTKISSNAKNNKSRRETTIREPKKVNPPRPIPKGYEDRVRYDGKNWCYLRDGRWYSYDHYIEPATYYSRPLAEFGTALVVGAVVGLITALVD